MPTILATTLGSTNVIFVYGAIIAAAAGLFAMYRYTKLPTVAKVGVTAILVLALLYWLVKLATE